MDRESVIKQERSVAVYGRVDVVSLAETLGGLIKLKMSPKSMSSLVSYCVELAHSALEQNGHLEKRFGSVMEAYNVLKDMGFMTKSMDKINLKKVNMARGFENMRFEGGDPEIEANMYYKGLHNKHSVDVPKVQQFTRAEALAMVEKMEQVEKEKMLEQAKIDAEKMIEYQRSKMVDGVYTPLDGHNTVEELPVEKPEEKIDYSKIVDNTPVSAPMKIHPKFQKDNNPNEVDWDKVKVAKMKAQKELDDRIKNEKVKDKIKEKLIKQQVKIEVEKAKLNQAECAIESKLEEIDQGYATAKVSKNSEQIRSKTDKELDEEDKLRKEKEHELLKNLDYIPPLSGGNS